MDLPGQLQSAAALADRYRIERELGQGGMATVYLAHDLRHERKVAIKVLRPDLAAVIGAERFVREIRTIAALQHPHILGLIDSGELQGTAYYVMPFVEGESLRDRLAREKQLPVADAVRIATEVASALDYAHRHGVIHRDIKPENILLHDGQALVADFGIALAMTQAGGTRMTETGMSLGTPHYMSPEQAMGEREITARSDVYALGAVTYEMLSGEPPFTGPTAQAIVAKVMTDEPRPLTIHRKTVPPHVEAAVLTALAKLPADRFDTAKQFAEALATPGPARTVALAAAPRPKRATPWLLAVAAGLLGIVAGYAAARSGNGPRVEPTPTYVGERVGGPRIAMSPQLSPDGRTMAFAAMEGSQTQVAVLNPESGDWKTLTHDTTRGLVKALAWTQDGNRIYYERFSEVPRGVYSISPLGSDDRLILPDASSPVPLADGSILAWRLLSGGTGRARLLRYWPETGKLDSFAVFASVLPVQRIGDVFPGGKEVVFMGVTGPFSSRDTLLALDLATRKTRVLSATVGRDGYTALAATPDGHAVLVVETAKDEFRVVSVPRDGSDRRTVLLSTTAVPLSMAVGPDGSIFLDQHTRPAELIRYVPETGRLQRTPVPQMFVVGAFPLPDGRVLALQRSGGGSSIAAFAEDRSPTAFIATRGSSYFPVASLGRDRIIMRVSDSSATSLVAAYNANGQIAARLPGFNYQAFAGSPDGTTVFFADSGAIWSMPIGGGPRRRLAEGGSVAPDPNGRYVVTQVIGDDGVHLLHVPLDGTAPHEIPVRGDLPIAPLGLAPNAVAPDGRILVEVVSRASWFWPAAILDPKTGRLAIVPPGQAYDVTSAGWDAQGRVMTVVLGLDASLWRFRPEKRPAP
jgi:tRNA A-37 threonylcarbamoyl transferase component Bud32